MNYRYVWCFFIMTIGIVMSGCSDTQSLTDRITPPIFTKVLINEPNVYNNSYKSYTYLQNVDDGESASVTDIYDFYGKNQSLQLSVYFINPDDAEIISITINETEYRTDVFEEESTNNKIVFTVNTGVAAGEKLFHIQTIQYTDGKDIRNVNMKGNSDLIVHIKKEVPILKSVNYSSVYYDDEQKLRVTLTFENNDEAEIVSISINGVLYKNLMMNKENSKITLELDSHVIKDLECVTIDDITFNNLYDIETVDLNYEFETDIM